MSSGKHSSRRTGRTARMPATKFPHLQKRMKKVFNPRQTKTKKPGM
jgi:hypothetical protein